MSDEIPKTERPDTFYNMRFENRTLCAVLEEMRRCHKTRNYGGLMGLIEEAQSFGNRMESGLERKKAIRDGEEYRRELREEILALEKRRDDARKPAPEPPPIQTQPLRPIPPAQPPPPVIRVIDEPTPRPPWRPESDATSPAPSSAGHGVEVGPRYGEFFDAAKLEGAEAALKEFGLKEPLDTPIEPAADPRRNPFAHED